MQTVGGLRRVAAAAPDGGALSVGALPGLHHKTALHAGDGQAVVIALLHKAGKVVVGLRGLVREEHCLEHARRGVEHRHGVPCRRVRELLFRRLHRRAVDLLHRGAAPAGTAKAAARQCQHCGQCQYRPSFFTHSFPPRSICCIRRARRTRKNSRAIVYHIPCRSARANW